MIDREEVIKGLYAHGYRDCKSCPYWGAGENGMSACRQLARDAYALLKEQEPMKPKVKHFELHYASYDEYEDKAYCPKCGIQFIQQVNYCPKCGQAVKWE